MYKDSLVTMNNKNSAIFLAAVLLVGIIGMASPLIGSASASEEKYKEKRHDSYDYKKDRNYDSYDSHDYKKDRNYDSYDSHDYKKDRNYGSDYEKDYKKDNSYGSDYEKDYKKDMSYGSDYEKDYKKDMSYGSDYEKDYGSDYEKDYKKEKKYDSYDPKYQKAECNVNNFNVGQVSQVEVDIFKNLVSQMGNGAAATTDAASTDEGINSLQQNGPTFGMGGNGMQSNGGGGIELEFENICLNFGDNSNSGTVQTLPNLN
jgi:hypothetical protein